MTHLTYTGWRGFRVTHTDQSYYHMLCGGSGRHIYTRKRSGKIQTFHIRWVGLVAILFREMTSVCMTVNINILLKMC